MSLISVWSHGLIAQETAPAPNQLSWALQAPVPTPPESTLDSLCSPGSPPPASAEKRVLLRRLTYDLTGLPPTPQEMDAFLGDAAPNAYQQVLERLLASPAYGEKWGRHWLDLVRYADTGGDTADYPAPQAWRYRNWVIDAFNRDLPYHEFICQQIAGDLLTANDPPDEAAKKIVATGFWAIARRFGYDGDADMHLTYEDAIDTLGKSVLGLTLGCARCHDHKYDPVSLQDYYGLYGILASTRFAFAGTEKKQRPRDLVPLPADPEKSPPDFAFAVIETTPTNARIQKKGEPKDLGDEVPRRLPALFGGALIPTYSGSGRLQLAECLVSGPARHLTARVIANRVWAWHFGTGIVATPNDFGSRGAPPTNAALLDFLTSHLLQNNWSIKSLHRLILTSAYFQRADFPRRRLTAEEVRDTLLAASAQLDRTPGGPHPFPAEETWTFTQHGPFKAVYDNNRRSVYQMVQRIQRHPFLALFDGADPNSSTPVRSESTVPTQALYFLNDPFVHAQAKAMAAHLMTAAPDDATRLNLATRQLYGRSPTADETTVMATFLATTSADFPNLPENERTLESWSSWLRVLFGTNELLYVD